MLWTLFEFGTVAFWSLCAIEFLILFIAMRIEKGLLATVSVVIFAVAIDKMGSIDLRELVVSNWENVLVFAGIYLALGLVWGILKWIMYYRSRIKQYCEVRTEWLQKKGIVDTTTVPDELKADWFSHLKQNYQRDDYEDGIFYLNDTPKVSNHKGNIMRWMAYWPISMLVYICGDMLVEIFKKMYNLVANFLQSMADKAFEGIAGDLKLPENLKPKQTESESDRPGVRSRGPLNL